MIEILLQAERALTMGLIDQAERMYRQAANADPRNSIAVVGLARVALERGDEPAAWRFARAALVIDGENVAAQRLAARLEEVWTYRGESLPDVALAEVAATEMTTVAAADSEPELAPVAQAAPVAAPAPAAADSEPDHEPEPAPVPAPESEPAPVPAPTGAPHVSVLDRLFRRNRQ